MTTPGQLSCAVLVLNWNGASWLRRCLPSVVEGAARASADVIVVDNNSSDESRLVCREFQNVAFENVGANYVLVAYDIIACRLHHDVIVLLNNDLCVDPGFLEPLLHALRSDDSLFSVSPQIRTFPPAPDSRIERCSESVVWSRGMLRGDIRRSTTVTMTFFCPGGAMACWRQKFVELGGFNPLFLPAYYRSTDLGWRAWKHGWRCGSGTDRSCTVCRRIDDGPCPSRASPDRPQRIPFSLEEPAGWAPRPAPCSEPWPPFVVGHLQGAFHCRQRIYHRDPPRAALSSVAAPSYG